MASKDDDFEEDDFTPEEYKAWKKREKQRIKTVLWDSKRSKEFEKLRGSLASLSGVGDTLSVYHTLSKDFVIRHLVNIVKGLLMSVVDTSEDYLSFKDDFIRELNRADPDVTFVDLSKTVSGDAEELAAPEVEEEDYASWIDPEGVVTMEDGTVVKQGLPAQKRRRGDDEDYDPGDDDDDEEDDDFDSDFDDSESGGYCFGRYPYWIE